MAEPPKKTAVKADAYPNSASQQEFGCLLDSERNRAALQAPHEGIANVAARLVSLSAVVQAAGSSSHAAMRFRIWRRGEAAAMRLGTPCFINTDGLPYL